MKRKLKKWVIPTGIITSGVILSLGLYMLNNKEINTFNGNYVIDPIIDISQPVNNEIDNKLIRPYNNQEVKISKYYYNKDDTEENQQKSLIYYENIYMQNTGVLYSSDNEFDVLAISDGTIKNVKEDKIMGTTIEIEVSENINIVYHSLNNVTVSINDKINKGDIIATSGKNSLKDETDNCLHIEVFKDGVLINPENIYDKEITEI